MTSFLKTNLMALAVLTSGIMTAQAQDKSLPESPAGRELQGFVTSLNSGDSAAWAKFILTEQKARDSAEVFNRRIQLFKMLWDNHGGFDVQAVNEASEYRISALVKSLKTQAMFNWLDVTLLLDSLPPHGLKSLALQPAHDPNEWLPEGPLTDEVIAAYVNGQVDSLAADDRFSGAVAVAHKGEIICERAAGPANRSFDVPNRVDTKFNLGSMNKMFTAVAIAQLAEQGKLAFDDTVGKFLPDYPNPEVRSKVTIHHLLTHTSGMGDYWDELFACKFYEVRTVQQLADLTADKPLEFEPGTKFRYSNAGPVVLGLIIEKLSGEDYYTYIREHVAAPSDMANTDSYDIDLPVPNLAVGYTYTDLSFNHSDQLRANYFLHAAKGGPAGGGYSTVGDLIGFARTLMIGKLVGLAYVDTLTTAKADFDPDGGGYGYLFGERLEKGHRIVGHTGGAPGINAVLRIYTDLGYTVAVLSNDDHGALLLGDRIDRLLLKD